MYAFIHNVITVIDSGFKRFGTGITEDFCSSATYKALSKAQLHVAEALKRTTKTNSTA